MEGHLQPAAPPERAVREHEHGVRARLGVEDGDLGQVVDEDVVPPAPPQGGQVARQLEEGGAQLALARYRGDMGRYGGDVTEIWGRPSRS